MPYRQGLENDALKSPGTIAAKRPKWGRSFLYFGRKVQRIQDTPHKIALGFACGAVASFTPFFGFHFVVAATLAWIARGNIMAALAGTIVGNPITFPAIVVTAMYTGNLILNRKAEGGGYSFEAVWSAFGDVWAQLWHWLSSLFRAAPHLPDGESAWDTLTVFYDRIFHPYLVGGIGPGILAGVASYFLIAPLVAAYQKRRRDRLSKIALSRALERTEAAQRIHKAAEARLDPGQRKN